MDDDRVGDACDDDIDGDGFDNDEEENVVLIQRIHLVNQRMKTAMGHVMAKIIVLLSQIQTRRIWTMMEKVTSVMMI